MLVKLALVVVFVYAASARVYVIDENEIIDYVMEGYQMILNEASADQNLGG